MERYHRINVEIVLNTEDELYGRLKAEAERRGTTVEAVVESLIYIGSYGLMAKRLNLLEEFRDGSDNNKK